jgi:hypothetical protein
VILTTFSFVCASAAMFDARSGQNVPRPGRP